MIVSKLVLLGIAAVVWYGGGIALFLKAGALVQEAYALDAASEWTYGAPIIGIVAGLIKAKFIFLHACKKNIARIKSLANPRIWQFFRPGMLIFLGIIIPTGATMSRMAAGKFGWLCTVAALDLSIGTALLISSLAFWKMGAFRTAKIE
jgi:hypothetical protein